MHLLRHRRCVIALFLLRQGGPGVLLPAGASMAGALLNQLLAHTPTTTSAAAQQPAFAADGLLSDESLASLAELTLSQRALHAALLLTALEVVPPEWLAQLGQEVGCRTPCIICINVCHQPSACIWARMPSRAQ